MIQHRRPLSRRVLAAMLDMAEVPSRQRSYPVEVDLAKRPSPKNTAIL
jgi:hypothetical protein